MLTCPWCGYAEIEPETEEHDGGTVTLLAECEVCGAEQIDPAELDSEPHKDGWRVGDGPVKMYNSEKHGPLQEQNFAISCGRHWQATTQRGRLVNLPEDHPMVIRTKEYDEAMRQINTRVGEPTGG
jgi:hypothetical protein